MSEYIIVDVILIHVGSATLPRGYFIKVEMGLHRLSSEFNPSLKSIR